MINEYSLKYVCSEDLSLIENYEQAINDNKKTWVCHHRLEIDENKTAQQLKDEGRYYHRPASELIFLTYTEHWDLHHPGKRKQEKLTKKIRINNGKQNKVIYREQLQEYLENGYKRGMLYNIY